MDFSLTEDQAMIRDMARDFANDIVAPRAKQADLDEALDPKIFESMTELGLWGLTIPEEFGGAGLDNQTLALVLMEINKACASTGVTLSVHNSLVAASIIKHGTDELKSTWLPKLATGEVIGAYCLTEAGSGSDSANLSTSAVVDGDDYVINGTKMWVTNGGFAGMFVVYARTDFEIKKTHGVTAFIVPRDTPGVTVGKKELKTGIRGSSTTEIHLENVRIPKANVLGQVGRGFHLAMDTLDGGRIGIAAQAVGIGEACLAASIKYSNEREQFGRAIGQFQAIQWKLADMSARLRGARLMTLEAAWTRDNGEPCSQLAAQAKLTASIVANFCADECLQIHGGAGYTDDFHVERLFRDARITEIYEGATDIQRLVVARKLLA